LWAARPSRSPTQPTRSRTGRAADDHQVDLADLAERARNRLEAAVDIDQVRDPQCSEPRTRYNESMCPPICPTCGQPASEALGGREHDWECRNEACPEFGQPVRADELPARDEPDAHPSR
jgi:hypothetical protein